MKHFKLRAVTIALLVLGCIFKNRAENRLSSDAKFSPIFKQYMIKSNDQKELTATQKQLHTAQYLLETEKLKRNTILISSILLSLMTTLWYRKLWIRYQNKIILLEKQWAKAEREAKEALQQNKTYIETIREKSVLIADLKKAIGVNQMDKTNNHQPKDLHDTLYNGSLLTSKQWMKFRVEFEKLYPLVLLQVKELTPRITSAEERLICLIYLQLGNKQIGAALGISMDSVARSKRRLKLRLPVPTDDCLENFIFKLNTFIPLGNFNQQLKTTEG